MTTPRRLPAEWETQETLLLTWPQDAQGAWKERVQPTFLRIAKEASEVQRVVISVADEATAVFIQSSLGKTRFPVDCLVVPSNDVWVRDHGPITVLTENEVMLLDFQFNGWGNKYPCEKDNAVSQRLHSLGAFGDKTFETIDCVLEGGSIDSDGQGTVLTTRHCLANPNRNPNLSRHDLDEQLKAILGCTRLIYLDHGELAGDDTDSHVDLLARFCDANTIAYCACDDPDDPHATTLKKLEEQLKTLTQTNGDAYRLVPLPIPAPIVDASGQRLPASYCNFLILNKKVLVPTYDDPNDALVLSRLSECFPDRNIVEIPSPILIEQYGAIHCATQSVYCCD